MSGRDLRAFITNYRAEDAAKLTTRMKNGLGSSKYKQAEYQRLKAMVEAKRQESDLIGQKVHQTLCAAMATKESATLRQHRQVWSREYPRLQKTQEMAENDLCDFVAQIRPNGTTDTAIFSLQDYELFLERERESFRIATVEPVHELRDDLLFRLGEVQQQLTTRPSNWEQVLQQVKFVKDQQDDIIAKLNAEYQALDKEIMDLELEDYLTSTSDNLEKMEKIPEEVLDSDCPYPDLKESLVQAFHSLSERYQNKLQDLQQLLKGICRFCGWCADDHLRFQVTVAQYPYDTPNRRVLYMDMLQRHFPDKTRQELTEHERMWDWQRFTQAQLRAVTQQWQRDHGELLSRALVTLQEARHAHQEELEFHRDRQLQHNICAHLRQKLQQWRAQQEEVAKLEAAIAARRQEEEEERLKRRQEKEAAVRSQQKDQVRRFYRDQRRRREEQERKDQDRLAHLRSILEDQARRDKARVRFRADMLLRRREEREVQELERQREEEEKRNRLEALRNQVAVVAEADPGRMMADTEAWRSRQLNLEESELQKPLYVVNTYTDTQIVSDPRFRIERALREAGLHRTQYAKEALSRIKPPKPPRRDTKSVLKF
ncbi:coiled-coil domain-containing protein 148-like [Genypterus blacodes]|uniref:coiled-coil domain-containing protein 148-like n=1 Tax=Genypterus blacodes TaxID=154954 RepID=UPI003F75E385